MPPIHSIVPRRSKLQYQWNRKSDPSARTKSLEKKGGLIILTHPKIPEVFQFLDRKMSNSNLPM